METPNGNTQMSIFDLSGRVAVITGGNGGIGLGIAQALAGAGCSVSIWGRNVEKNKAASATMASLPGRVDTRICDVSDPASVKQAMKATLDAFGRVDGCFANAGIGGGGRRAFIDRTEEEWRKMFATNLDGVFHVFQAAARHMTERAEAGDKFGRLVATSSLMANDKFVANVMPRIPMRRFGEPADFGGIAVYLMSKASSYHTADCFVIDGGYTAF